MSGSSWRSLALAAFVAVLPAPPGKCDESTHTMETIRKAWQRRREAVRSIDYVATGQGCNVKGSCTDEAKELSAVPIKGDFPPHDRLFPARFRVAARFADKHVRVEGEWENMQQVIDGPPVFYTKGYLSLFDGVHLTEFVPPEYRDRAQPYATQLTKFSNSFVLYHEQYPFLVAHGIVPYAKRNLLPDDLAAFPTELPYGIVGSADKGNDASRRLLLRTPSLTSDGKGYFEVIVDPSRDYLIERFVSYVNAKPWISFDLEYQRQGPDWVLSGWHLAHFGIPSGRVARWYKMQVVQASLNPDLPDELFRLSEEPGMVVFDVQAQFDYVAGPNGTKTPVSVVRAREESGQVVGWGWSWWLVIPLAIVGVLLGGYLVRRRIA